jgi:hypothetical protein
MSRFVLAGLLLAVMAAPALADPITGTTLPLSVPGGWVLLPDGVTLVVSQPEKGQLAYFDAMAEKEVKRVDLDFKPSAMTMQGDTLFVAAKGASVVYALDAMTGKQKKEIALGGDAVANLASHPSKGLVYATTVALKVYSIDPATATATKTSATGNFIVVDPVNGSAVFTCVQPTKNSSEIVIKDFPGGSHRISTDRWGPRAFIIKYSIQGKDLKLVSSQKNAAANAFTLTITPDGKKVLTTSGGGWRPTDGATGGGYGAVFSADNLENMIGQAPGGHCFAFHPVLNLAVANRAGRDIQLFNPRSFVTGKTFNVSKGGDSRPLLLTFGGKGTKVILWNGENPKSTGKGCTSCRWS